MGSAAGSANTGCGPFSAWSSWEKLSSVCVRGSYETFWYQSIVRMFTSSDPLSVCPPCWQWVGFLCGNDCGADPALCSKRRLHVLLLCTRFFHCPVLYKRKHVALVGVMLTHPQWRLDAGAQLLGNSSIIINNITWF